MDIRQRLRKVAPETGILHKLKDFDAYAKPLEDFRIKTITGATVSIISTFLILFLLWSEFSDWMRVEMVPSLQVDKSRKERMHINLNMTFPKLPCFSFSIDVKDVAGELQSGVDDLMHKTRIDQKGNWIEKTRKKLGNNDKERGIARNKTAQPGYCGSCYGAKQGCCNTCDDVRKAYQVDLCDVGNWVELGRP
jgi:endoplasmic reticulum-Golgi intermediate compartment protein 3